MRIATMLLPLLLLTASPAAAQLYVGIETGTAVPMFQSDLGGFPNVTWNSFHAINVSGAAARPDGTVYVCNGSFTTDLYEIAPGGNPTKICTIDKDITGMAFGRGNLYGYSNYATPKGIYEIDPATGVTTLVLDVYTGTSYRFFALGYNPVDDLFYGYTEYGSSGLYSINIDSGLMTKLVGTIPASNGQGRGLAVGNNTVYLTATRGDAGIPFYAYDLSQGAGGVWVGFDNAYPNHHSTGGAAWVPGPDTLNADTTTLSQSTGGVVTLDLDAGTSHAGRLYLLFGGVSGTQPGTTLPGGLVIPLNRDFFTDLTMLYANSAFFADFQGTLNFAGKATAHFNTQGPLPPGSVGRTVHFAGTLFNPFDFVTNAVAIDVVP
jgi:hypothetical protein